MAMWPRWQNHCWWFHSQVLRKKHLPDKFLRVTYKGMCYFAQAMKPHLEQQLSWGHHPIKLAVTHCRPPSPAVLGTDQRQVDVHMVGNAAPGSFRS